ncbi:MAG: methyltransferase domain-containing protein [Thiohalocapsa sp.]
MTDSADRERAAYFQDFSRRVIDRAAELCAAAAAHRAAENPGNPCGDDLDQADLELIAAVAGGNPDCRRLSPWQEAQAHELAFWRWVACNGYGGKDPLMFPLLQEHFMVSTFYRTGWTMAEFQSAAILELGCGPLGMIEYLPAARRVAFDPLNDRYSRLFGKFRSREIEYVTDRQQFLADRRLFDLAICHNVLDHTDDAAGWFEDLFARLATGGRFIFQVNLSRPNLPRSDEHRRMHPSPLGLEQVMAWLAGKSDRFEHFVEQEPNADNEFYFLAWGTKIRDAAAGRPPSPAPAGGEAAAPRPLGSSFSSAWLAATSIKGGAQPFANLPPIGELLPEPALAERARREFGIGERVAGYRGRDAAPLPCPADRENYYGDDHAGYWLSGLSDALSVTREARRLGLGSSPRYFELGCASGRVVRHVAMQTQVPIVCCDINQRHTEWIRQFLPARIAVFQNSIIPSLPLEDCSVDIAAAFSVFTHIDDFETAWLLELRRVLRRGGLCYVTVATDHTWERYRKGWIREQLLPLADRIADYPVDEELLSGPLPREKTVFWWSGDREVYAAMVFHHADYIRREWGRLFTVRDILPDRHFFQDVVLLTK